MSSVGNWGLEAAEVVGESKNEALSLLTVVVRQRQQLDLCPVCQGRTHWHGRRDLRRVVDTPAHGYRVRLDVQRRRSVCVGECQRAVPVETPFLNETHRVTTRLWTYLAQVFRMLDRQLGSVAVEVGLSERSAERIFSEIAEAHMQDRLLQPVLGQVLRIEEVVVDGRAYLALLNVREGTLVELLAGPSVERVELTWVLQQLGRAGQPMHVLIPAREEVRDAVRRAFPAARIVLTQTSVWLIAKQVGREGKGSKDLAVKKATVHVAGALLAAYETYAGDMGRGVKEKLRAVRVDPVARAGWPWLDEWVEKWEQELLNAQLPLQETRVQQEKVVKQLRQGVELLNRMGRRYAFKHLRLRVLYALGQVEAHRVRSTGDAGRAALGAYRASALHVERVGPVVGTFGVSLEELLQALDRAVQDIPPELPELLDEPA